ncbi:DUF6597 domain-containing transcriptional factor [Streptomyces sp.]|uniref:DUF6597 domain-containing transcriptional factor n=1 Tax=Streptomyces sp. TaxID=1931 RepID=UPI0039C8F553
MGAGLTRAVAPGLRLDGVYAERSSPIDGAVVWTVAPRAVGDVRPVLPDGCTDLLWSEGRPLVAGPDTRPYLPGSGAAYAGVRFAPGDAPGLLRVPAHELRDRRVELADLWGAGEARRLADRVAGAAARTSAPPVPSPGGTVKTSSLRQFVRLVRSYRPLLPERRPSWARVASRFPASARSTT